MNDIPSPFQFLQGGADIVPSFLAVFFNAPKYIPLSSGTGSIMKSATWVSAPGSFAQVVFGYHRVTAGLLNVEH